MFININVLKCIMNDKTVKNNMTIMEDITLTEQIAEKIAEMCNNNTNEDNIIKIIRLIYLIASAVDDINLVIDDIYLHLDDINSKINNKNDDNSNVDSISKRACKALTPKQLKIYELHKQGLSQKQIAEMFDVKQPAISIALTRIKNKL